MEDAKVCTKCGLTLPLSAFGTRTGRYRKPMERHAECKKCKNARIRARYKADPAFRDRVRRTSNIDYQKLRAEVIAAYGGKCSCCGEAEIKFLSIDHLDGKGADHRREIGGGAKTLCNFLKREGFPPGFTVLCFNCNCAKGFFGTCPHQSVDKQQTFTQVL